MLIIRSGWRVVLLLFSLFMPSLVQSQDWVFYSQLQNFNFGGSQPIHQLINEMEGSARPGSSEAAFSHFDIELGAEKGGWRIGYFLRHDYYARFSKDTIELVYGDQNDLPVDKHRPYDLWFKIHQLRADGLRLTLPSLEFDPVKIRLGVSLFHATELRDGLISGQITTTDSDFGGLIFVDYAYDKDTLLDRPLNDSPVGWGLGLDVRLEWRINDVWNLDLQLKDLGGQIHWDKAPYTTARVTSSTVNFDDNGFIETTPVLLGIEGYKNYVQNLPLQSQLRLDYYLSERYRLFGANDQFGHEHFPSLGVTVVSAKSAYSVAWQGNSQAIQVQWESDRFRLKLTTDDVNLKKIKTFGLDLELVVGS